MPVHIEEMSSDVTVIEGELPLTAAQIEKLVKLVMKRIADQSLETARARRATELRHHHHGS